MNDDNETYATSFRGKQHKNAGSHTDPRERREREMEEAWHESAASSRFRTNDAQATAQRWFSRGYRAAAERGERDERGRTIKQLQDALAEKNKDLDALHYVWCDGGCKTGVHRHGGELTEELVTRAEHMVARMRDWLANSQARSVGQEKS